LQASVLVVLKHDILLPDSQVSKSADQSVS